MQRDQDWLRQAEAELSAARDLFAGGHWSWCCFTSQQSAEKALKAACDHFRTPYVGHNLNLLRQAVEGSAPVPGSVAGACARLNRYYIPTRYPDAFPSGAPVDQFFDVDAQQAVDDASEVVRFVEPLVRPT